MAVAAFKSSSRRGNQSSSSTTAATTAATTTTTTTTRAPPTRRSRSVSAFSRTSTFDFPNEFLNKRDNPLFDQISKPPVLETSPPPVRGRSVARNGEPNRKDAGRSVSRVDTGRRSTRSASQCPVSRRSFNYSTSESEADCKARNGLKLGGSNRKDGLFGRPDKDAIDQEKDMRRWSSQHSTIDVSDCFTSNSFGSQTQNCDDAVSTASSGFGCDEITIKAVCEQKSVQRDQPGGSDIYETVRSEVRRAISEIQIDLESAIQVSNASAITVTDMADIHPDLLSPGTVELALETRREYTKKLEEAEERARRLRADLAVEEHRVRELDRILREVLPYPKTPNIPKSRPSRKSSIERKRMSRRLAEDAKAYFDECVSLSTFDSSDFSSQEDPPLSMVGPPTPSRLTEQSSTREQSHDIHYDTLPPPASIDSEEAIHEQVSSTADSKETDSKHCFSFAQKPSEGTTVQQDIQQYIKKFEKSVSKLPTMRSSYGEMRDYSFQSSAESLLIDRVMLRSRIESGRFLLCGGGNFWSS
ncbi:uncharacterized protein LOC131616790 [Vicia villosa]|uniref:uncharacterized protein LOC131616790 n=1 Tax=Vicia villosa TaxID=3911 RepID=UPI00273CDD6F|nr:uncharacterized protein LOC131616790 [Vicia villosa]